MILLSLLFCTIVHSTAQLSSTIDSDTNVYLLQNRQSVVCLEQNCNSGLVTDNKILDNCLGFFGNIIKEDEIADFCIAVKKTAIQKPNCGDKCHCKGDFMAQSCVITVLPNKQCQVTAKYTFVGTCELDRPVEVDPPFMDPPNLCQPRQICGADMNEGKREDGPCDPHRCDQIHKDNLKDVNAVATRRTCTNNCECKGRDRFDCDYTGFSFDGKEYCYYRSQISLTGLCAKDDDTIAAEENSNAISTVDDVV